MQVNSSSGVSLPSPLLCFSNSTLYPPFFRCYECTIASISYMVFNCANLLLFLPVYVLVLWTAFQRWRQRCSTASHSDAFIHHSVTLEIIGVLGSGLYCVSLYTCGGTTVMIGFFAMLITYPGQTFFHCLTCVERYLAVVHPVTYRGLKKDVAVRVRNISIGCLWLICFGLVCLSIKEFPKLPSTLFFVLFFIMVAVINFSSFSVLHALIRLGLGKVGGDRRQIDQSKLRAFHTVMAVLGTLVFRLSGLLLLLITFDTVSESGFTCVSLSCAPWLCVPSSLVLPLLFLSRAGTFTCCSSDQNEN